MPEAGPRRLDFALPPGYRGFPAHAPESPASARLESSVPMKFDEACVLLPCHSLEDFPTHYEGASAEGLLAAWSALWHPALLAACGRLPTWYRADGPPDALAGRLIMIPSTSEPLLLAGWAVAGRERRGARRAQACTPRRDRGRRPGGVRRPASARSIRNWRPIFWPSATAIWPSNCSRGKCAT